MFNQLRRHPESRGGEGVDLSVRVVRVAPRHLALRYDLAGDLEALMIPPRASPERTDELWRHTCFEAFVQVPGGGYHEFNLAPSGQWAAYRFDGYRRGMTVETRAPSPALDDRRDPGRYGFDVQLALDALTELPAEEPWRLGVSAVLEERGGDRSYWALVHPPGKPDFHHPDSFALELPASV